MSKQTSPTHDIETIETGTMSKPTTANLANTELWTWARARSTVASEVIGYGDMFVSSMSFPGVSSESAHLHLRWVRLIFD